MLLSVMATRSHTVTLPITSHQGIFLTCVPLQRMWDPPPRLGETEFERSTCVFCIFQDIVLPFLTRLSEFLHGDCKHKRYRLDQSQEEVRDLKHFPRNLGGCGTQL